MPKAVDPVRDMVRASVQHHLLAPTDPNRPQLHPLPEGVKEVETRKVDEQNILFKVTMEVGGIRYFNVKVSEQW